MAKNFRATEQDTFAGFKKAGIKESRLDNTNGLGMKARYHGVRLKSTL